MTEAKIRLFVEHPLTAGQPVPVTEAQAHYLTAVMRLTAGARLLAFNGRDGEWVCAVQTIGKRRVLLTPEASTRPQRAGPDLWLLFAPVKRARSEMIVEKAVELGVARLLPVQTRYTQGDRLRADKLRAHAIEAAEQCGALAVPDLDETLPLDRVLANWPADRKLVWCDESRAGQGGDLAGAGPRGTPCGILIGPEGGFAPEERDRLAAHPATVALALGPRILRAETAAMAAMVLWQAQLGDWG